MDKYDLLIEEPIIAHLEEARQEENSPKHGYDKFIPGHVDACEALTCTEKYFYALLRNLCNQKGYCWATNGYLAKNMKVVNRTIQNWIHNLREQGFIKIILYSDGFYKRRRIVLSEHFKIFLRNENEFIPTRNGFHTVAKADSYILKKDIPKKEEEFSCPNISPDDTEKPPPFVHLEEKEKEKTPSNLPKEALEACKFMFDKLLILHPKAKYPNFTKWGTQMAYLNRVDHRSYDEIREVINWIFDDAFWCRVILSPEKLRKNWDAIIMKKLSLNNKGSNINKNKELARKAKMLFEESHEGYLIKIVSDSVISSHDGISISLDMAPEEFKRLLYKTFNIKD